MCQQCIIYVVDRAGAFDIIENGERPSNVAGISIRTGIKKLFPDRKEGLHFTCKILDFSTGI